jgi:hypothetical protein
MRDRPIDWPPPAPAGPPVSPAAAGWPPSAGWPAANASWPAANNRQYPPTMFPPPAPLPPPRPTYREPHPVRPGAIAVGALATACWLLLTGLLGQDLRGYALVTLAAGAVAWGVAVILAWIGDRGVATGIALAMSAGWSIAAVAIATHWAAPSGWPLRCSG